MNNIVIDRVTAAAMLIMLSLPAGAHHSSVMFDMSREITVTGVVREFQYTNPHSWLLVDVTNEDGRVITWGFEAEGPSTLIRAGIRVKDLAPGIRVTVTGHPMKNGKSAAAWIKAVREQDGREFYPRQGFRVKQ